MASNRRYPRKMPREKIMATLPGSATDTQVTNLLHQWLRMVVQAGATSSGGVTIRSNGDESEIYIVAGPHTKTGKW